MATENRQERGDKLYTRVFDTFAPHADYLQPEFEQETYLTPIEWLYTITSVALGAYLLSFLRELGKKTADEFVEYTKKLRASKSNETQSALVVELFALEVIPAAQSLSDAAKIDRVLDVASTDLEAALLELGFPNETIEVLMPKLLEEVRDALTPELGQGDSANPPG